MPLLNEADSVYFNGVRADRVYAGDVMIWPDVERWSAWMEVGAGVAAAPAAWFVSGVTHYDAGAGGHQRVMWRYSLNTKRIVVTGLARTTVQLNYGDPVITINLDPNIVPKPATAAMSAGISSPDTTALWGGSFMRVDMGANATYHSNIAFLGLGGPHVMPAGAWMEFDTTWALGEET